MTKISYHILGAIVFGFGLLLVIKLPNSDSLAGASLFHLPAEGSSLIIRITAALLQIAGILLFLKWFEAHGEKRHKEMYEKYGPIILIFLIFLVPILINAMMAATVKSYVYAGKDGRDAVEIIRNERPCTVSNKQAFLECAITLKNYNHRTQKVNVQLNWEQAGKSSLTPVYLVKRQEKTVYIRIPMKASELQQFNKIPQAQQPEITLQ
ncbi:hypothetical protein [Neobacillus muris]|uniref:hypothetical protein n=1 Tax=Neobacillus muris TaxID=2941334 RepID=UPI00203D84B4|nr:hypothetical protein [Neobacillus muris]